MKALFHKPEHKFRVGAYPRVSTDGQSEEQTIETQDDNMVEFLKNNDDHFEMIPMQSGATLDDPKRAFFRDDPNNLETWDEDSALAELFRRIERGEIDTVLIYHHNRLFRSQNRMVRAYIESFLEQHQVRVFSTSEGELKEGFERDIKSLMGAQNKKDTVRSLHAAKFSYCKRDGRPPNGKSPYGYAWNSLEHKNEWSAVKDELAVVRWAVGLAIGKLMEDMPVSLKQAVINTPDGLSAPKIAETLNDAGLNMLAYYERNGLRNLKKKNPKGLFEESIIRTIFEKEDLYVHQKVVFRFKESDLVARNVVKETPRREVLVNMPGKAAVEAPDWAALKASLYTRFKGTARHVKKQYLLQGLLQCSHCGLKLGAFAKHKKYVCADGTVSYYTPTLYYQCNHEGADGKRCPYSNYHNAPALEAVVWDEIGRILTNPESISDLHRISHMSVTAEPSLADLRVEHNRIDAELAALDKDAQKARMSYTKGVFTLAEYNADKAVIEAERKKVEKKKRDIEARAHTRRKIEVGLPPIVLEEFAEKFARRLDRLTFEEQRLVVQTLVDRIVIAPDSSATIKLRPIQRKSVAEAS